MRSLRSSAVAIVFTLAIPAFVAGCLPLRDNGGDPALKPAPALSISNGSFAHGACAAPDSLSPSFSRARCLFLDASASTDPQGAPDIVTGTVQIAQQSTNGADPVFSDLATLGTDLRAVVQPATLGAYATGSWLLRARLVDRSRHTGEGPSLPVTFANARPIAVAPGPRLVSSFGAEWKVNGAYPDLVVHLSGGASTDPDNDALQYSWEVLSDDEGLVTSPLVSSLSSSFDFVVKLRHSTAYTPTAILVRLSVYDGDLTSDAVSAIVVDAPPAWAEETDTGDLLLMDLDRDSYALGSPQRPDPNGTAAMLYTTNAGGAIDPDNSIVFYAKNSVIAFRRAAGDELASVAMPDTKFIGLKLAAGRLWAFGISPTGTMDVFVLDYAIAPSPSLTLKASLATGAPLFSFDPPLTAWDEATSALWVAPRLGLTTACGYSWTGGSTVAIRPERLRFNAPGSIDRMITGLSVRAVQGGGHEVWAALSTNVFQSVPAAVRGELQIMTYDAAGVPSQVGAGIIDADRHPVLGNGLFTFDFINPNRAWIGIPGVGMATVEPTTIEAGGFTRNLQIRTLTADVPPTFNFAVNHQTGQLLGIGDGKHRIFHVSLNGSYTEATTPTRIDRVLGIDDDGKAWMLGNDDANGNAELSRGLGSGIDGIVGRFPSGLGFGSPVVDYSSGDLWKPSVFPSGAQRYYSDGRIADVIGGVSSGDGFFVDLAPPKLLAVDPAKGWLWIFLGGVSNKSGSDRGYLVSPYKPRDPDQTDAAVSPYGTQGPQLSDLVDFPGEEVFTASVVPSSGALVMLTRKIATPAPPCTSAYSWTLRKYAIDGTLLATTAAANSICDSSAGPPRVARDIVTGQICVAIARFDGTSGYDVTLRHYSPGLVEIGAYVPGGSGTYKEISSLDAAPGECWMGYEDGGASFAVVGNQAGPAFNVTPPLPLASAAESMRVQLGGPEIQQISPARNAWSGGSGGNPLVKLNYDPAGNSLTVSAHQLAVPFSTHLLAP